jgi:hypothetical protein
MTELPKPNQVLQNSPGRAALERVGGDHAAEQDGEFGAYHAWLFVALQRDAISALSHFCDINPGL